MRLRESGVGSGCDLREKRKNQGAEAVANADYFDDWQFALLEDERLGFHQSVAFGLEELAP